MESKDVSICLPFESNRPPLLICGEMLMKRKITVTRQKSLRWPQEMAIPVPCCQSAFQKGTCDDAIPLLQNSSWLSTAYYMNPTFKTGTQLQPNLPALLSLSKSPCVSSVKANTSYSLYLHTLCSHLQGFAGTLCPQFCLLKASCFSAFPDILARNNPSLPQCLQHYAVLKACTKNCQL